ncbi:MAG: amidohydrolase family protein [Planctomycetota bacterium]
MLITRYRARWILPLTKPPIQNGCLTVRDDRIEEIGPRRDRAIDIDLGDVAIIPGLVNAHTHLEFSDCKEPIGAPGMDLADWVAEVVASRSQSSPDQTAVTIRTGLNEIKDSAAQLVGEIATPPWPRDVTETGDPIVVAMAEVLGLTEQRGNDRFDSASAHLNEITESSGISPHAPYSTPPSLVQRCVHLSRSYSCPLAMHVAESESEIALLEHGRGPFAERLTAMGIDVASHFPHASANPIATLINMLAQSHHAMLVHANYLKPDHLQILAKHDHLSVVYCPRTHAFFGHSKHPVAEMLSRGINVALGTDSRASNPDLDVWGEVRFLLNHRQDIHPLAVLVMATIAGHKAIRGKPSGELAPGQPAKWHCIATQATSIENLISDFADYPGMGKDHWQIE